MIICICIKIKHKKRYTGKGKCMRRSRPGILNAVEAETLAYANFVESLFAVKFL